jgi:preprotein translocase subunit Sec63
MENTYQKLTEAREILEVPEKTTLKVVKSQYRKLLKKWHPDTCLDEKEKCHEMTQNIVAAYTEIMDYCEQYKISFAREDMGEYLSPAEWWNEHFGNDPLWGNPYASR